MTHRREEQFAAPRSALLRVEADVAAAVGTGHVLAGPLTARRTDEHP